MSVGREQSNLGVYLAVVLFDAVVDAFVSDNVYQFQLSCSMVLLNMFIGYSNKMRYKGLARF